MNDGDGPRYTKTFFPSTLIWKRGEPPPQSPVWSWNCAESAVSEENVVPAGTAMSTPPESFVVAASEKSETILTSVASCVAVPKSVTPVAANDGAATKSASAQVAAKSSSRFI